MIEGVELGQEVQENVGGIAGVNETRVNEEENVNGVSSGSDEQHRVPESHEGTTDRSTENGGTNMANNSGNREGLGRTGED